MSLLDDALKAATILGGGSSIPVAGAPAAPSSVPASGSTFDAGVDLTGAHATLDTRVAKNWSTHLWGDVSWSGDRSAGISLKGSF